MRFSMVSQSSSVLVETIQGQLDLYHAVFVIHMLSCLTVLQFYGMNYVSMRIYRVLIRNENTGLSRFLSAKSLNRFQTEDNSPRSIMLGLHYFTSLVALRVDQRLPIWCATRVQSPRKICLFLRHRPSDCKLAKDIISRWRLLGLVLCLDQSQIDTCATQGPVRELERSIGH